MVIGGPHLHTPSLDNSSALISICSLGWCCENEAAILLSATCEKRTGALMRKRPDNRPPPFRTSSLALSVRSGQAAVTVVASATALSGRARVRWDVTAGTRYDLSFT